MLKHSLTYITYRFFKNSDRKRKLFKPKQIRKAWQRLYEQNLLTSIVSKNFASELIQRLLKQIN
ncbi:hypothetical protein [Scytonema sp. NUACC21]